VLLRIITWWQPLIFKRLETRSSSRLAQWVLARREGWSSLPAATVGGVYVLGLVLGRVASSVFSRFDLTRRVLAYWFRREIAQKTAQAGERQLRPIARAEHRALDIQHASDHTVEVLGRDRLDQLGAIVKSPRGHLVALVGERGSGKTTLIGELLRDARGTLRLPCPTGSLEELERALATRLELDGKLESTAVQTALDARGLRLVVIDDLHRVLRQRIGGLETLDRLFELLGVGKGNRSFIFSFDTALWRYVKLAWGGRPAFDEVVELTSWSEKQIAELLTRRSEQSGLEPSFEAMLTEEPIDEMERADQLRRTETNYYRLLWDYAGGNPAVALHFWRESLRLDADDHCLVQLFAPPPTADLEELPDQALFVLRAILQSDSVAADDVVAATTLAERGVRESLRYLTLRGYVDRHDERYVVNWAWYRAVTRVLQRRHLLAVA
jgi:hypothetical protein